MKYITIYNIALALIRKESSGQALKINDFKDMIPLLTNVKFNKIYDKYNIDIKNTDSIKRFSVNKLYTSMDNRIIDLPTDYYHHRNYLMFNGDYVDILSENEFKETQQSYLLRPTETKKTAKIETSKVYIYPQKSGLENNITLNFPYIRKPNVPEFNFEINPTTLKVEQFDDAGFDFEYEDQLDVIMILLEYMSIPLKRQDVFQIAKLKEKEEN